VVEEIPFNRPFLSGAELGFVEEAVQSGQLASGGPFTTRCQDWLTETTGASKALLANSGTAGLEAAMMLAGLGPGDEAIMPSFAYPTIATAAIRQGAMPVFVDIDPDTLNLSPDRVREAVGPRTKAIAAVHYGGVGCDIDSILEIAAGGEMTVVEDAAHGLLASDAGRPLGAIGDLGVFSFHETKNVTCGEGGALLVNRPELLERAEAIWEKGTDRGRFLRGEVDRYSWVDIGSSFGASEISAAFLWGQLQAVEQVTSRRREIWARYHEAFAGLEADGLVRRPQVPETHAHNGHLYYLVLQTPTSRDAFIAELERQGIVTSFHYVPLHSAPAGKALGRTVGAMTNTDALSRRLVRLPLWPDLAEAQVERVIEASRSAALGAFESGS
jgi:dTDP-4-amino-4,6-dideoxygalactose transaminase